MVKLNVPLITIAMVIALTILSAVYRVSTAPERVRMRIDTAKASCQRVGGEWIKVGREESCQPARQGQ